jgi:hypothetical protein
MACFWYWDFRRIISGKWYNKSLCIGTGSFAALGKLRLTIQASLLEDEGPCRRELKCLPNGKPGPSHEAVNCQACG